MQSEYQYLLREWEALQDLRRKGIAFSFEPPQETEDMELERDEFGGVQK